MIAVDASALLAIAHHEPDFARFEARILSAERAYASVVTIFEASIVTVARHGQQRLAELDTILQALRVNIEPVSVDHLGLAREAFARFGKGQNNAAKLNLGDCFSYALARSLRVPLLFKGNDFTHTDIVSAL
jgi:ribonuclease VapC